MPGESQRSRRWRGRWAATEASPGSLPPTSWHAQASARAWTRKMKRCSDDPAGSRMDHQKKAAPLVVSSNYAKADDFPCFAAPRQRKGLHEPPGGEALEADGPGPRTRTPSAPNLCPARHLPAAEPRVPPGGRHQAATDAPHERHEGHHCSLVTTDPPPSPSHLPLIILEEGFRAQMLLLGSHPSCSSDNLLHHHQVRDGRVCTPAP